MAVLALCPNEFEWKNPPYEYDHNNLPIDLILGDVNVREQVESLTPVKAIEASYANGLSSFMDIRKEVLMY
jgi:hypothetical protein